MGHVNSLIAPETGKEHRTEGKRAFKDGQ